MTRGWDVHKRIVGTTLLAALVFAAPALADNWDKTFSVTGKPTLVLRANDGNVRVDAADIKQVEARVRTTGWRIGSGEVLIRDTQDANRVEISVRVPQGNFGIGNWGVQIEFRVPREADLDLNTADGNIRATGVSGAIRLNTNDGNLTLENLKGELRASTHDGNIEGINLDGPLDANTGDGDINLRGRWDRLNLRTGDGNINVESQPGTKMTSNWAASTGDGNIALRLPRDFACDLDAHTGGGSVRTDFEIITSGKVGGPDLRGRLNGGGQATLTLRTGDGDIRLTKI